MNLKISLLFAVDILMVRGMLGPFSVDECLRLLMELALLCSEK